jgi:hypothetical protein
VPVVRHLSPREVKGRQHRDQQHERAPQHASRDTMARERVRRGIHSVVHQNLTIPAEHAGESRDSLGSGPVVALVRLVMASAERIITD